MPVIITNGTVVHNTGKTSVLLTNADGPQSFTKEIEAQLVAAGVAEYVNKAGKGVATPSAGRKDSAKGTNMPTASKGAKGQGNAQKKPAYSVDMKPNELNDLMKKYGLTNRVGMTKAEKVAALDEYFSGKGKTAGDEDGPEAGDESNPEEEDTGEAGEEDGELPPDLTPADPE